MGWRPSRNPMPDYQCARVPGVPTRIPYPLKCIDDGTHANADCFPATRCFLRTEAEMDARLKDGEKMAAIVTDSFVRVRGAREHNLKRRFTRNSSKCAGGVHRRFGVRQVLFGVRDAVCGSPAPLSRIRLAIRPPALSSNGGPGGGLGRGPAAGRSAATTAGIADNPVIGRERHHVVQPATDALFARRRLIRATSRCSMRNRFRRIRPKAPVPTAMASVGSMKSAS